VWTTKNRIPFLKGDVLELVVNHIRENARTKGIFLDHINGYDEHLHALISMGGSQNISDIMQLIKGESSFWINKNKLTSQKFEWQDDFYSVSVGQSQLQNLRTYIRSQVYHHRSETFKKELDKMIKEYNLQQNLG
jgi:REP element-mobilizing transposase RayT